MTTEQQILSKLDRLTNDVARLRQQSKKEDRWVAAYWVQKLTGWKGKELERARNQGLVKHRKNDTGGVEYLLSSIPEEFKKKPE